MLSVLGDEKYAENNQVYNETVNYLLRIATPDENTAYLVDKYEHDQIIALKVNKLWNNVYPTKVIIET